jgi:hypothetical protein
MFLQRACALYASLFGACVSTNLYVLELASEGDFHYPLYSRRGLLKCLAQQFKLTCRRTVIAAVARILNWTSLRPLCTRSFQFTLEVLTPSCELHRKYVLSRRNGSITFRLSWSDSWLSFGFCFSRPPTLAFVVCLWPSSLYVLFMSLASPVICDSRFARYFGVSLLLIVPVSCLQSVAVSGLWSVLIVQRCVSLWPFSIDSFLLLPLFLLELARDWSP